MLALGNRVESCVTAVTQGVEEGSDAFCRRE
jgi:hypothetical protein